jgi:glycosyltransferase involved in cell wall biosynthesis
MRVLSINQQNILGGAADIALGLVHSLNKKGSSSELWYFWEMGTAPSTKPLFPVFNNLRRNKTFNDFISPKIKKLRSHYGDVNNPFYINVGNRIKKWKPDVIHLHNLHGGWVDLGITARIAKRIPTVITLHDEWLLTGHCGFSIDCLGWKEGCSPCPHLDRYVMLKRDISHQLREKKRGFLGDMARHNGVLVCPSDWLKNRVIDSGLWQGREVIVIHNGINVQENALDLIDKKELRSKLGLDQDEMIGIFVADGGSANYFKGYDILQKACLALPENVKFTLLVAGDYISAPQVQKLGSIKEIRLGFLTKNKLQEYLKASDVFLYPSKADSFGLVVAEAMASELLVMASNVGGIPEVLTPQTGILVDSCDALKWCDAIVEICQTKGNSQIMGKRARERVIGSFTYEKMFERYLKLYESLLEH